MIAEDYVSYEIIAGKLTGAAEPEGPDHPASSIKSRR